MKRAFITILIFSLIVSTNIHAIAKTYTLDPASGIYGGQYLVQSETPSKNKYIAALLALIIMHQFYLGNTKTGIIYWVAVLIFGLGYAVSILDCLTLLFMDNEDFQTFIHPDNPNTIPVLYLFEDDLEDAFEDV